MAIPCKRVVLCRGISEKDDTQEVYTNTLKQAGYACVCLQTLRFEFVNIAELRACLLSPDSYFGLILTSRRAVEAVGLASKEDRGILHPWENLPVYCVGPATESFAKNHLGFKNCLGSHTGNAKELADKIISSVDEPSKVLLYPCSEIARETIQQTLHDEGVHVKKLIAYRTLASESLEHDLLELLSNLPMIFVFFSPSTVEYIMDILKKKTIGGIKAVAIGPVTRQALVDAGFEIYATAIKPEPLALLEAISQADSNQVI